MELKVAQVNNVFNIQVPFLTTLRSPKSESYLWSPPFSAKETPNYLWKLQLIDKVTTLGIYVVHINTEGECINIVNPVLVKLSIANQKGEKIHQQVMSSKPDVYEVPFKLTKEEILNSNCQQANGSLTFYCEILSYFNAGSTVMDEAETAHPLPFNCSCQLIDQLEELFDGMLFSDFTFNVRGREFQAHKCILATRSRVFAAMFQHPTKENLSSLVVIEDTEPDVFYELLRFIYTGRVPLDKMNKLASGLLVAADKYLLDQLKAECENHLHCHMSVDNCFELLLIDQQYPADQFREEAIKFFRRHPVEVMATDGWKKMKEENPRLLCDMQEIYIQDLSKAHSLALCYVQNSWK
ncbi:speckle-type POZ protein-like [Daphnia pulicaria]|uniref:speckle-type POZ protein-like n=1 Tax=Daphnia pulicaria TaxID=35523 RepID=UPI001EE9EE5F|nr:speckle-type POZ protein-like [Daphnia pulicaria]